MQSRSVSGPKPRKLKAKQTNYLLLFFCYCLFLFATFSAIQQDLHSAVLRVGPAVPFAAECLLCFLSIAQKMGGGGGGGGGVTHYTGTHRGHGGNLLRKDLPVLLTSFLQLLQILLLLLGCFLKNLFVVRYAVATFPFFFGGCFSSCSSSRCFSTTWVIPLSLLLAASSALCKWERIL